MITKGKLIYEASRSVRIAFQVRTLNSFLDLEPIHRIHLQYLKRRYLKGPLLVDSHVILARIDKIRECIANLRGLAALESDVFFGDASATDSAERNLQIAIQSVIDIGNHVVADMDCGTPKDYKEIFHLLAKHSVISGQLAAKLVSMTGLRNVLVHDYLQIDLHLIHRIIKNELNDFEEFVAAVLRLI